MEGISVCLGGGCECLKGGCLFLGFWFLNEDLACLDGKLLTSCF